MNTGEDYISWKFIRFSSDRDGTIYTNQCPLGIQLQIHLCCIEEW